MNVVLRRSAVAKVSAGKTARSFSCFVKTLSKKHGPIVFVFRRNSAPERWSNGFRASSKPGARKMAQLFSCFVKTRGQKDGATVSVLRQNSEEKRLPNVLCVVRRPI